MTDSTSSEVIRFHIEISQPSGTIPTGKIAEGAYVVRDGKVMLTDLSGRAVTDGEGKVYEHTLKDGEDPAFWARVLMRELRKAVRGKGAAGFSGPIDYPKLSIP